MYLAKLKGLIMTYFIESIIFTKLPGYIVIDDIVASAYGEAIILVIYTTYIFRHANFLMPLFFS